MPRDDIRTRPVWIPISAPAEAEGYGSAHASTHEDGGSDEIDVTGLSGVLADQQDPQNHHTRHENGGVDEVNITGLDGYVGDLQDAYSIQGRFVTAKAPAGGDALVWSSLRNRWEPGAASGGGIGAHHLTHENGGSDEVNITGLDGYVGYPQNAYQIQGRFVTSEAPDDKDGLVWSTSRNRWEPGLANAGFIEGYDVFATQPDDGYCLVWNDATRLWEPHLVGETYPREAWYDRQTLSESSTWFGGSAAIWEDTLVIGLPNYCLPGGPPWHSVGAVNVYTRSGGLWILRQKLLASDYADGYRFGAAVAIHNDTIVVGAPGLLYQPYEGAAYVFARSAGVWSQQQKLTASDHLPYDRFGMSVGIWDDTVVVGAPKDYDYQWPIQPAACYAYTRSGTVWTEQQKIETDGGDQDIGWAVTLYGDVIATGSGTPTLAIHGSETVFVFERDSGVWTQETELSDPDTNNYLFGADVSIWDGTLAVSTYGTSVYPMEEQRIYLYDKDDGAWALRTTLRDTARDVPNHFGISVRIHEDRLVTTSDKDGYEYIRGPCGVWSLHNVISWTSGAPGYNAGQVLALHNHDVIIGSLRWGTGSRTTDSMTAHFFQVYEDLVSIGAHASQHEKCGFDELDLTNLDGYLAYMQDAYAIQGRYVVGTPPVNRQSLVWDEGNSRWQPDWHGANHEVGGPDEISLTGLDGYLADRQDAYAIQGRLVSAMEPPADGYMLAWHAASSRWLPRSHWDIAGHGNNSHGRIDDFMASHKTGHQDGGGDELSIARLDGYTAFRQDGYALQGRLVSAAAPPADGYMLAWHAASSRWVPRSHWDIAGHGNNSHGRIDDFMASHKTGHQNGGGDELDLTGLDGYTGHKQDAYKIQGTLVTGTAPADGQTLVYRSSVSRYVPGAPAPAAHHTTHENGGSDEISVAGLSGQLADAQTPLAHKTSHQDGGSDELDLTGLDGYLGTKQDAYALQGRFVTASAPTDGQVLAWDDAASHWAPKDQGGGLVDGYLPLPDSLTDPEKASGYGALYVKNTYDGYSEHHSELFYEDDYGQTTQLTHDGYLAVKEQEDELDPAGTDGYDTTLTLTNPAQEAPRKRSGYAINMFRNGILMRYVPSLGSNKDEWTYDAARKRVQFVASESAGDWYTAIYHGGSLSPTPCAVPAWLSKAPATISCQNPRIHFTVADTDGVRQNTLIVYISGELAIDAGVFQVGYDGPLSLISAWTDGSNDGYEVTIDCTSDLPAAARADAYADSLCGGSATDYWEWAVDLDPPYALTKYPPDLATDVDAGTLVYFSLTDDGYGVDQSTIDAYVGGGWAYDGASFRDGYAGPLSDAYAITGGWHVVIDPESDLPTSQTIACDVFAADGCGNTVDVEWSFQTASGEFVYAQKIVADDRAAGDLFSYSLGAHCYGDGNFLVLGAYAEDDYGADAGCGYVFKEVDGYWTQQQQLWGSDTAAGDLLGFASAICEDTVVIGARDANPDGNDSGAAYVFRRYGDHWTQEAKLVASDSDADDEFGCAVDIDGDTIIVGARYAGTGGQAYIFTRTGTTWTETAKLVPASIGSGDRFGSAVGICGDRAIITAFQDDDYGADAGCAYIFERTGTWSEVLKFAGDDTAAGDAFGMSCAIDGYTAIVGAYLHEAGDTGAAYVFTRTGAHWSQQQKLTGSDTVAGDNFGRGVDVDGDTAVVGAFKEADHGTNAGCAYIFTRDGSTWTEENRIDAPDAATNWYVGGAVAVHEEVVAISSRAAFGAGASAGAAYIWKK